MPWYESAAHILSIISAGVAGVLLWFLCGRFLSPRFRFSGITVAASVWAARFLVSELLTRDAYDERQLIRFAILLAVSIALVCFLWKGQFFVQLYVACAHNALFDICFFLSYCVQYFLSSLLGAHIESLFASSEDPVSILAYTEAAVTALNIASVAFTAYLLWACAKFLTKNLPSVPNLKPPEVRLILLPAVAGMLTCLLFRLLLFSLENGVPVSVFERVPSLFALTPCIMLLLLASILYSVRTLQSMRELALQSSERLVLGEQLRLLEDQVALTERQNETVRRMRHDLLNTISVVSHLSRNDPAGLEDYLTQLKDDARGAAPAYTTGSTVADALLSMKARKLADAVPHAVLEAGHFQLPGTSGPAAYDLGIIVSNALDNAIDGTRLYYERNPGAACEVKAAAFTYRNMLFLRIENPCVGADVPPGSPFPATTKPGDEHGLGLRNILAVAQKYGGTVDYEVRGGTFILSVMLGMDPCAASRG